MTESLADLPLKAFFERLSSRAPTPGGGSVSALAGAAGAALLHMVLELSAGRAEHADDATLAELLGEATSWQSELLELVQLDAAAYDGVVAARRLPRETELEKTARGVQLEGAVREATRVPLEIARRASDVLELAGRVAAVGNRNAISDVGVAALLAEAAIRGAALNVRINLPSLPVDDPLRAEADAELSSLLADLDARAAAVHAGVDEWLA